MAGRGVWKGCAGGTQQPRVTGVRVWRGACVTVWRGAGVARPGQWRGLCVCQAVVCAKSGGEHLGRAHRSAACPFIKRRCKFGCLCPLLLSPHTELLWDERRPDEASQVFDARARRAWAFCRLSLMQTGSAAQCCKFPFDRAAASERGGFFSYFSGSAASRFTSGSVSLASDDRLYGIVVERGRRCCAPPLFRFEKDTSSNQSRCSNARIL